MSEWREAQKRWNWINGWLTAALHACIAGTGLSVDATLSVDRLLEAYCRRVRARMRDSAAGPPVEEWEIDYVLHLEEELWGLDWRDYLNFFPQPGRRVGPLQTFHFVLAFYLIERCLKLLAEREKRYKLGHGSLRRRMFGVEQGLFTGELSWALEAMGPPFALCGSSTKVSAVGRVGSEWDRLRETPVPEELKRFYGTVTGREHFTEIVEKGLINTRKNHLVKHFRRARGERLPPGTRSWWYDVLWRYSESIRYHPLAPSDVSVKQPFHWNRTIRWFTSVLVSGLLLVAANRGAPVRKVWWERSRRQLWQNLGGENRFD